ncbi:unnamed protein product [Calypogeia fissa]
MATPTKKKRFSGLSGIFSRSSTNTGSGRADSSDEPAVRSSKSCQTPDKQSAALGQSAEQVGDQQHSMLTKQQPGRPQSRTRRLSATASGLSSGLVSGRRASLDQRDTNRSKSPAPTRFIKRW